MLQVRVTLVKDGKIDVTQMSKEDEEAEEAAKGGVGTMSRATAEAGNMFQFALARAGISGATFETDVRPLLAVPARSMNTMQPAACLQSDHAASCRFQHRSCMRTCYHGRQQ